MNILCVQKTKLTNQKAKEVDHTGFKLWYTEKKWNKNGVAILIDKSLKNEIVVVRRQENTIIMVKLVIRDLVLNIISAYVPQVDLSGMLKDNFEKT
jgi:exonuclease III